MNWCAVHIWEPMRLLLFESFRTKNDGDCKFQKLQYFHPKCPQATNAISRFNTLIQKRVSRDTVTIKMITSSKTRLQTGCGRFPLPSWLTHPYLDRTTALSRSINLSCLAAKDHASTICTSCNCSLSLRLLFCREIYLVGPKINEKCYLMAPQTIQVVDRNLNERTQNVVGPSNKTFHFRGPSTISLLFCR